MSIKPRLLSRRQSAVKRRWDKLHAMRRNTKAEERELVKLTTRQLNREIEADRRKMQ